MLVENGGTVVIGGIYTQSEKDGANQVPLLADMPLLGPLFQNRQRQLSKTELLVFLTPRVLSTPARSSRRLRTVVPEAWAGFSSSGRKALSCRT